MTFALSDFFTPQTAAVLLNAGLDLAAGLGLPITSWRVGDPTRSLFSAQAEILANRDAQQVEFFKAGFLSWAEGDWLTLGASEVFGIDRVLATPSTPTVTVHNGGGGYYPAQPGDLTFKSSITGTTFHNTNAPAPLSAGATVTYQLVADVDGSDGTVSTDDIDTIVTSLALVTVVSSTAAIGADEQPDADLKVQCRASTAALSPSGPKDIYEFVARSSKLTGVSDITRARSVADNTDGTVIVYLAGAAGTVAGGSITAANDAIEKWATPLCHTPEVLSGSAHSIAVTATLHGTGIPADYVARATLALTALFAIVNIADASGATVDTTLITAAIRSAVPNIELLSLSLPAAPVALTEGQFPTLGAVTITEI